ncbi:MAG: L-fucose mutarotase [Sphaerochaetaceae bacterium]|jgi:L-fucose mutarotase|nr:L-fucose mutarotase [Sphaerochaetaceae bacterium]MDD4396930.1 L-fucose mutarotase [Sphaerochaetaceae bacterium]MDY4889050.1 L-fucose mutarotase [Sphaerochaetaceae bacterium]
MLKNIPNIISPELLKILMEMGHGDEIVITDGNFPAVACAQRLVRLDGHGAAEVLEAILKLLPLDSYSDNAILMSVVPGDKVKTPIWDEFRRICKDGDPNFKDFTFIDRYGFYERTRKAFAVVYTGETALYGNVLLKKGVIK